MAKQPRRRPVEARSSDNDKRALRPLPSGEALEALAARARYEGSGKHKEEPRAFRLEPAPRATDDTTCDGNAGFTPDDMARVPDLLDRGIRAGLLGHVDKQDDPSVLWTVDDNGWVYELRITTPTQALYHGYPLLEGDAFAKKVISRYTDYVYANPRLGLLSSLEQARERYA
jgi:hypothetical protein